MGEKGEAGYWGGRIRRKVRIWGGRRGGKDYAGLRGKRVEEGENYLY